MFSDRLYIATLPSFSSVWRALLTGHEQIPLGFFAIERLSWGVFGINSVALRLPALLGCLVMSLALFKFVSRRLSPAYGLLASVFPMTTSAFAYAREARPYGLELAFAALALVCWQQATESNNRLLALIGLWLSFVAAISCHYYGILLILPLAFGELIRTIARRRVDFGIWSCFVGSTLPLVLMLPLILSGAKLLGNFWAQPGWTDIASFYQKLITTSIPSLVAVVTVGVVASRFRRPVPTTDSRGCRIPIPRAGCDHWLHRSTPRRRPISEARYPRLHRSLCPSGRSGTEHSVRSSNAQDVQGRISRCGDRGSVPSRLVWIFGDAGGPLSGACSAGSRKFHNVAPIG